MNWSGSRDLHPDRLLHRERCCSLHHNPEKWRPRQELHLRPPPSQSGALIYLSYADKLALIHKLASAVGLAPTRPGLKGRPLELLCIHGQKIVARKTKPTGWLLADKP